MTKCVQERMSSRIAVNVLLFRYPKSPHMPVILIEDDKILRVIEAIVDPKVSIERLKAFADFNSTAVEDFSDWLAQTRRAIPALVPSELRFIKSQSDLHAHLKDADLLITESLGVSALELSMAPRLQFIQQFGTQTAHLDQPACAQAGVQLKSLRRRTNIAMAEHTMMLCLNLAKRFTLANRLVSEEDLDAHGMHYKPYDTRFTPNANYMRLTDLRTMNGSTLCLLGFGEIAQEVSRLAQAFGMRVLCHKSTPLTQLEEERYGVKCVGLAELLSSADFLSIHVPMTEKTRNMIAHEELAAMPKGSFLINTARAAIVDHDALVNALQSEHLAGAAFDVHYTEPVQANEVLRTFNNFLATPHIGGASRLNVLKDIQEVLQNCQASYA